jgi:ABC-type Fe3+/spermidine/putrescine transport system ATPase subunit/ABC-type sulfate transport system permease component
VTRRATRSPLAWLGGLLALYLLVPVVAFVIRFAGSDDRGFGSPGLWSAVRTSAESATIATALIALFGIPLANWLANTRGPIAAVVGVIVQLPLALPPVMSGIILIYIVGPYTTIGNFFHDELTDSLAGVVIAQTFVAAPFLIIAARSAFAAIDPALDDLAATLGHRPLARFWLVSLRIAAPGIRAGLLLTWLRSVGEYGATVLLAYHPYSLPVFTYVQFSSTGIPTTQAPTAIALAVATLAIVLSQLRRPNRLRARARVPLPQSPRPGDPTLVSFDLDVTVGTFQLVLSHQARSHRVAILGPSGSGKSITLRSLAGLLGPAAGMVSYGDEVVTKVATPARHVGYVPQNLGLFPGRTVWQQLLFATDADAELAAWWLHTLQLDGLQDRLPHQLSGGQRQRVSLAQALSHRPRVVLLDEPFSALDAPVREELRGQLRRLQRDTGLSTVLVTHDPEEAALLADEILVIDNGRLLQAGSRADVYNRPASPQVARLLGIQNLNEGRVSSATTILADRLTVEVAAGDLPVGREVLWCIRPDRVVVAPDGRYSARVDDIADIGTLTTLTLTLADGPPLRVRTTDPLDLVEGDTCRVNLSPSAITMWPVESSVEPAGPG